MAIDELELSFIRSVFRPVVDMYVENYKEDGHTLETAWTEFLKQKPEGASDETHEIMQKMFNDSWNEEK